MEGHLKLCLQTFQDYLIKQSSRLINRSGLRISHSKVFSSDETLSFLQTTSIVDTLEDVIYPDIGGRMIVDDGRRLYQYFEDDLFI